MITFDPVGAAAFTVGGATVTNPFPKYSISREVIRSGDDTPIANVYSITVTGQMLASGDITVGGGPPKQSTKRYYYSFAEPSFNYRSGRGNPYYRALRRKGKQDYIS